MLAFLRRHWILSTIIGLFATSVIGNAAAGEPAASPAAHNPAAAPVVQAPPVTADEPASSPSRQVVTASAEEPVPAPKALPEPTVSASVGISQAAPDPTPASAPAVTGNSYINVSGDRTPSPAHYDSAPAGASARCRDGTYSMSAHRSGTCSHHGGVAAWL